MSEIPEQNRKYLITELDRMLMPSSVFLLFLIAASTSQAFQLEIKNELLLMDVFKHSLGISFSAEHISHFYLELTKLLGKNLANVILNQLGDIAGPACLALALGVINKNFIILSELLRNKDADLKPVKKLLQRVDKLSLIMSIGAYSFWLAAELLTRTEDVEDILSFSSPLAASCILLLLSLIRESSPRISTSRV